MAERPDDARYPIDEQEGGDGPPTPVGWQEGPYTPARHRPGGRRGTPRRVRTWAAAVVGITVVLAVVLLGC